MKTLDEREQLVGVIERLAGRFPDIDRSRISSVVTELNDSMAGNPIRDFIPVLIEHDAKSRLRAELAA